MTEPAARWFDYEVEPIEALAERFSSLRYRDMLNRAITALIDTGHYDPARHGNPDDYPPLTAAEHLGLLAMGEAIARHVRHPAYVHTAVKAGASWQQIAAARGTTTDLARVGLPELGRHPAPRRAPQRRRLPRRLRDGRPTRPRPLTDTQREVTPMDILTAIGILTGLVGALAVAVIVITRATR